MSLRRSWPGWIGGPALAAALFSFPGCTRVVPSGKGERCAEDLPCTKGLRCSFKKKRCYRPVDCDRLAKRLHTCTRELMETFSPAAKKLPAEKRGKLLPRIREHLKTEVAAHCKYDAAEQKRLKGAKPTNTKSWGEDENAEALNGCLAKGPCAEFARCFLGLTGVLGDRQKDPQYRPVFPLELPRPASSDAGVDAGAAPSDPAPADRPAPAPAKRPAPAPGK